MNGKYVKIFVSVTLWIIAVSCEMVVGEILMHSDLYSASNLILVLYLHVIGAFLSFFVFRGISTEEKRKMRFRSCLCGLITLFLPVIGIFGVTGSFLLVSFVLKKKGYFSTTTDPLENDDKDQLLFKDISDTSTMVQEETNIEPIRDILNGDDPGFKRGAINLLRQIGSKEAIHLLKKCISDPDEEVRFYTSAALKKLNDDYIQQLKEAKEIIERGETSMSKLQKLGDICKKYAESDLCEQSSREYYLGQAKEAYFEALILDPENFEITTDLGYVCIELKEYEEAERYLKRVVTRNPDHLDAILWLWRLYYEKWDLETLAENLRNFDSDYYSKPGTSYNRELIEFWKREEKVLPDGK